MSRSVPSGLAIVPGQTQAMQRPGSCRYDDRDLSPAGLIDMLETGTLPSFRRQTWAEVTSAGTTLRTYPERD